MVGIYFTGTGNSKYAAELFCKEYDKERQIMNQMAELQKQLDELKKQEN